MTIYQQYGIAKENYLGHKSHLNIAEVRLVKNSKLLQRVDCSRHPELLYIMSPLILILGQTHNTMTSTLVTEIHKSNAIP